MRFLSFEVQGFKNLVAPVRLDKLGPINVLHGENNIGKSNLLRAMELFFVFLNDHLVPVFPDDLSFETLRGHGIRPEDLFNYAVPDPIRIAAVLAIDPQELNRAGIKPLLDTTQVSIAMSLELVPEKVLFKLLSFRFADGTDIVQQQLSPEQKAFVPRFAIFLTTRCLGARRLPRVDVDRRIGEVIDALYDAHVSLDRREALQWERFAEAMAGFHDILGEGRFIAVLPRDSPERKPRLLYETRTMRIPLHALGTGVQQIIAVLGTILTSGASIVFVEEPEVHLRWALQERVRDALRALVGKEGAPSQLLLTSHSGAFEAGESFYLMQRGDPGPTVERRPIADAAILVGQVVNVPGTAPKTPTHVSSDGVLLLPERVRGVLGIEHGGAVSFVDKGDGVVEMMSDNTFLRRAGLDDDA